MATKIKPTTLRRIVTPHYTADGVEVWPNGLGINFRWRDARWEVLCDQDLRRLDCTRQGRDGSPTHLYAPLRPEKMPDTAAALVDICCRAWLDCRSDWTPLPVFSKHT